MARPHLSVGHPVEGLRVEDGAVQVEDDVGDGLHREGGQGSDQQGATPSQHPTGGESEIKIFYTFLLFSLLLLVLHKLPRGTITVPLLIGNHLLITIFCNNKSLGSTWYLPCSKMAIPYTYGN